MKTLYAVIVLVISIASVHCISIDEAVEQVKALTDSLEIIEQAFEDILAEQQLTNTLYGEQTQFESDLAYYRRHVQSLEFENQLHAEMTYNLVKRLEEIKTSVYETQNITVSLGKYNPEEQTYEIQIQHQDYRKENHSVILEIPNAEAEFLHTHFDSFKKTGLLMIGVSSDVCLFGVELAYGKSEIKYLLDIPVYSLPEGNILGFSNDCTHCLGENGVYIFLYNVLSNETVWTKKVLSKDWSVDSFGFFPDGQVVVITSSYGGDRLFTYISYDGKINKQKQKLDSISDVFMLKDNRHCVYVKEQGDFPDPVNLHVFDRTTGRDFQIDEPIQRSEYGSGVKQVDILDVSLDGRHILVTIHCAYKEYNEWTHREDLYMLDVITGAAKVIYKDDSIDGLQYQSVRAKLSQMANQIIFSVNYYGESIVDFFVIQDILTDEVQFVQDGIPLSSASLSLDGQWFVIMTNDAYGIVNIDNPSVCSVYPSKTYRKKAVFIPSTPLIVLDRHIYRYDINSQFEEAHDISLSIGMEAE